MKTFKLWIQIEEHDTETDEDRDLCSAGEMEPVPMGSFDNLQDAMECAESYNGSVS